MPSMLLDKKFAISSAMMFVLITSLPWAVTACNVQKPMFNIPGTKNMDFKLEDYKKSEDAQKKLLELYPIGSDYKTLADKLKSIDRMNCRREEGLLYLECEYFIKTSQFESISWYVSVLENAGKIAEIEAHRSLSYI
jgi:hypothetical protein